MDPFSTALGIPMPLLLAILSLVTVVLVYVTIITGFQTETECGIKVSFTMSSGKHAIVNGGGDAVCYKASSNEPFVLVTDNKRQASEMFDYNTHLLECKVDYRGRVFVEGNDVVNITALSTDKLKISIHTSRQQKIISVVVTTFMTAFLIFFLYIALSI